MELVRHLHQVSQLGWQASCQRVAVWSETRDVCSDVSGLSGDLDADEHVQMVGQNMVVRCMKGGGGGDTRLPVEEH